MPVTNDDDILKGVSNVVEEPLGTVEQEQIKTVSEAIRLHNENVNVRGVIVSVSELIKMISGRVSTCNHCNIKLETKGYNQPQFTDGRRNHASVCPTCNGSLTINYDYVNAVKVKLQDDEPDGQLEQLTCLLFGGDTLKIRLGETIQVKDRIEVEAQSVA